MFYNLDALMVAQLQLEGQLQLGDQRQLEGLLLLGDQLQLEGQLLLEGKLQQEGQLQLKDNWKEKLIRNKSSSIHVHS